MPPLQLVLEPMTEGTGLNELLTAIERHELVARFLDLADQFGSSIGPNGVDLAELLRRGHTGGA